MHPDLARRAQARTRGSWVSDVDPLGIFPKGLSFTRTTSPPKLLVVSGSSNNTSQVRQWKIPLHPPQQAALHRGKHG